MILETCVVDSVIWKNHSYEIVHLNLVLQTDSTDSLQYLGEDKSDYFWFNMHEAIVIFPSSDFPISPPLPK